MENLIFYAEFAVYKPPYTTHFKDWLLENNSSVLSKIYLNGIANDEYKLYQ